MNLSRRGVAKMLAAAPLVGRQIGGDVGRRLMGGIGVPSNLSMGGATQGGAMNACPPSHPPPSQLMQEWQALRLAKKVPQLAELMREEAFANNRFISYIDPDIDVCRSFSLAAKIAFQRQRNVARHLDGIGEEPIWMRMNNKIGEFLRRTMWGN